MHFFEVFLFIVKYIPFWATPLMLTGIHFAYIFWLKDYRDIAYVWGGISLFCLTLILLYFLLGGPDQLVRNLTQAFS